MNDDRLVVLGCDRSAGEALRALEADGGALPDGVEWVALSCGSALDELTILRAFEAGAGRVLVLACCDDACRSLEGGRWAEVRTLAARALLEEAGIAGWRLRCERLAPSMTADLLRWIETFVEPAPEPVVE